MPNTFEDYIVAVKSKYEVEKNKIYADFLLKPSPAQLRSFCLIIYDNGMSNRDKEVFELFFRTRPDTTLRKAIENLDVEKFRKICNFLTNKSSTTSQNSLNLIAILVGYEYRPFSNFLKSESIDVEFPTEPEREFDSGYQKDEDKKIQPTRSLKKKILTGILGFLGVASMGYTVKNLWMPEPQCMQWQTDHYEVVNCQTENQMGFNLSNEIIPYNDNQSHLIKLKVTDTTTFFRNGQALYWYCKVNGKPEFFNTHGLHPKTNKALKPVTNYIINKYVK